MKNFFKKFYQIFFTPYNKGESIIQFLIRQIMIPESDGRKPSHTFTIAYFILGIVTAISAYEIKIAMSLVKTYDATTGKIILEQLHGFSNGFYAMLLSLAAALVFIIKWKISNGKAMANDPDITPQPQPQIDPNTGLPIQQPAVQNPSGGIMNTIGGVIGGLTK